MRNDAACKTTEIGSIKLKMFDGKVRTLTNMRHVRKSQNNQKKHPGQAIITEETYGSCDILIASMKDGHSDDWFLDSACSYHMCMNKSGLCTYKDYNEGTFLMGSDVICKTIGIGSVKLKMFDRNV